jgi:hypothetical protein
MIEYQLFALALIRSSNIIEHLKELDNIVDALLFHKPSKSWVTI